MQKLLFRGIRKSLGRFFAIMAIIALGVGFFAGLRVTKTAMLQTGGEYLEDLHFFHFRLMSTLGLTQEDVEAFQNDPGVAYAEGSVCADLLISQDGRDLVMKMILLPHDVNLVTVVSGRLPECAQECVVDALNYPASAIGTTLKLSDANDEDDVSVCRYREYTIVGRVASPLYLNFERGTTSLGDGTVTGFFYVPESGLSHEVFTEINVRLNEDAEMYSDAYDALEKAHEPRLTDLLAERADIRYEDVRVDAQSQIDDARAEIDDGQAELDDAVQTLNDGETAYRDGQAELDKSRQTYQDGLTALTEAEQTLAEGKNALDALSGQLAQAEQVLQQGRAELDSYHAQADAAQAMLDAQRAALDPADPNYALYLAALDSQQAALDEKNAELDAAETEYASQAAQLDAGKQLLAEKTQAYEDGVAELEKNRQTLESADRAIRDAERELADARAELDDGWAEVEENRTKLDDARQELADAQADLDALSSPDTYVLGRSTNIGYMCFESDTNIVQSVSNVFPLFFFLVAALVCITTMTRMVDEERTQIGTLKALGFSDHAIMGNYLLYALVASLAGCTVGFLLGSWVFPKVLWIVYDIMYDFYRPIDYVLDWKLAGISVAMYLVCALLATRSACKAELHEPAASLIRPKAPKPGKRIWLERIPPVWNRLKFLHKVSARNVFRYKKRLFMMVLGIGGCMALLLTGLGLGDSIQNIVDDQFDEISIYDIGITYRKDVTQADRDALPDGYTASFLHESTIDVYSCNAVKSAHLVIPSENTDEFVCLKTERGEAVGMPQQGEAVLNTRLAEDLGVGIGGTVTLYDEDHHPMELRITGTYVNYIYNYIYVDAASCEAAWGSAPAVRAAYVHAPEGSDLHQAAAVFADLDNVGAVSVNDDMRVRVNSFLSNLNYIVLLVIFCAAALAFIVLYNLTNINIGERVREIATLKVLGFYPAETSAYVFRENMILTLIGTAVGVPLGILLHRFVMAQIRIDVVTFHVRIAPLSYLIAAVLCLVFALIVAFFMRLRIRKINMAESLKAAE